MRSAIWTSDAVLGLAILISTICSSCMVICLENEAGPQQQDDVNLMTSSSGAGGNPSIGGGSSNSHDPTAALFLQQQAPLNGRYFRNYYEMLRETEPVWKRAPAPGFFGMRGKKVPSSTFYGMRGKKGPSGFLGMRGKKSNDPALLGVAIAGPSSFLDFNGLPLKMKGPGSSSPIILTSSSAGSPSSSVGGVMDNFDDYSLFGSAGPSAGLITPYKRAPAEGFMGLRGKRSTLTLGQPSRSYK